MKSLSLKLEDSIFLETEKMLKNLKKPRNTYINEALEYYNKIQRRLYLAQQLKEESKLIAESSMEVLREWENIDPHLLDVYEDD
jgi:hypothetical protein